MPPPFRPAQSKEQKFTGWNPSMTKRNEARKEPVSYIRNDESDRLETVLLAFRVQVKLNERASTDFEHYGAAAELWSAAYKRLFLTLIPFEAKLVERFTLHWMD